MNVDNKNNKNKSSSSSLASGGPKKAIDSKVSDGKGGKTNTTSESNKGETRSMQLPPYNTCNPHSEPGGSKQQQQPLRPNASDNSSSKGNQHSPSGGSTSSVASSSSSNGTSGGYTRHTNPRPHRNQNTISMNNKKTAITSSNKNSGGSSFPASAVSAPPYVPLAAIQATQQVVQQMPPQQVPHTASSPVFVPPHVPGSVPGEYQQCPPAFVEYAGPNAPSATPGPAPGGTVFYQYPPPLPPVLPAGVPPPPPPSGGSAAPPMLHQPQHHFPHPSMAMDGSFVPQPGSMVTPAPQPPLVPHSVVPQSMTYSTAGPTYTTSAKSSINHGKGSNNNRYSPSPRSVSGSSSPSSFCQNHYQQQQGQQPHVVDYHIHEGETISLSLGDGQVRVIPGPAKIRMVSTSSSPPSAMPITEVPPGHMVQQIVDQNGTLQHVILSLAPNAGSGNSNSGTSTTTPTPGTTETAAGVSGTHMSHYIQENSPAPGRPTISSATSSDLVSSTVHVMSSNNNDSSPSYISVDAPSKIQSASKTPGGAPILTSAGPPGNRTTGFPHAGHAVHYGPPPGPPIFNPADSSAPSTNPAWISRQQQGIQQQGGVRIRDATHERLKKKLKQQQQHQLSSLISSSSAMKAKGLQTTVGPVRNSNSLQVQHSRPGVSRAAGGAASASGSSGQGLLQNSQSRGNKSLLDLSRHEDSEESGVGHEEEEEIQQLIIELLSNMRTPRVSEIDSRNALLSWGPPIRNEQGVVESSEASAASVSTVASKFDVLDHIPDYQYVYEVLLSDMGKDGKYREIFTGHSIECKLTDLRPNTEYHIRIHALYDNLRGGSSDTVSFTTDPCEPSTPNIPRLNSRSKTSLSLRWNAPADNGASINTYILEMSDDITSTDGLNTNFMDIFRGRTRNYEVRKLKPSSRYRFRVSACNEHGRSHPSEAVTFSTQGAAPLPPIAPGLQQATSSALLLVWSKRLSDEKFTLQMDSSNGQGFVTEYFGQELQYRRTGLHRNTPYRFRLQAANDDGESSWSEIVTYTTTPDVPGPPLRPASKGRIHPYSFKVRWDPPSDNGGSRVTNYILELDDGLAGWRTFYQGSETECVCDQLSPGTQYQVRVACTSHGGVSRYSDICTISTAAVCPGQCAPPRVHGKPKASSLHLKWGWPESDGGSRVSKFEIDMTTPDNETRSVYCGPDTECIVSSGVLPGRPYLFQVRAYNPEAGPGPWSESLEVISGAGCPDQPKEPSIVEGGKSGHVSVYWEPPINNGALIEAYELQVSLRCRSVVRLLELVDEVEDNCGKEQEKIQAETAEGETSEILDNSEEESDMEEEEEEEEDDEEALSSSESASRHSSPRHMGKAQPTPPALIEEEEGESLSSDEDEDLVNIASRMVVEQVPVTDHGFVTVFRGPGKTTELKDLECAAVYAFRVCAINNAGISAWSEESTFRTEAGPPAAVTGLKLKNSTFNGLSLAWKMPECRGEPIICYKIEYGTQEIETENANPVVELTNLLPNYSYSIRIKAVNVIGVGTSSESSNFSTRPLPPNPPKLECVNANCNSLRLKWPITLDNNKAFIGSAADFYTLEMENNRKQFHTIYSGPLTSYKVNKLQENTVYRFRICASNSTGIGPVSAVYEFTTAFTHPAPIKSPPRVSSISCDGCLVEWTPVKVPTSQPSYAGELSYKVIMAKNKNQEFKLSYEGPELQWRVNGLEAKSEYTIKVAAVRVPSNSDITLVGSFSPQCAFTTAALENSNFSGSSVENTGLSVDPSGTSGEIKNSGLFSAVAGSSGATTKAGRRDITDQQQALVIVMAVFAFGFAIAALFQYIISYEF